MKQSSWKKPFSIMLSGGVLFLHSAGVMAAPQELSLDDSVAAALKNNPSIKMAVSDKEKAEWGLSEAKAGTGPSVSVGTGGTHGPDTSAAPDGDSFSTSLKLNWTLYSGGRNEGLIDQAKLNADSAKLNVAKTEQQLRLAATTSYYDVLQALNLAAVNQETVNNLAEHLDKVQAQFEAGVVAKSDVLRSEVELVNARQNLTKAQNSYDLAMAALNNTIGMPLDTENKLKDELGYVKSEIVLADAIAQAVANRPEIEQSQLSIESAKKGIKVANSNRKPTVTFSAAEGWSGTEFPGNENDWSLSLMANWNIFDSGVTGAKVKQAESSLNKAREQSVETGNSVELEVRQAYLSMKEAEKRIGATQVAVDKATEDLKIAQTKYYAGAGTNLDVIDAQLALTQAGTNYTEALYDYNINQAKLQKAIGQK
ncbi:TolC family protein|uniref:Type I secretion outer membrane protein, TolC family n=1 Tax=Dendrosporobacter quercicolus TaxID=146817 RepID=A0A1H0AGP6_9FIRM|nr:TolC family protein [Dendrosporobacter quercicolus]NSL50071.1 TolC family protein [Dendrosporobacter quercicolus DSM 1736]SDN32605.1 type I secretion outer membrane protein, TolC family [Dendrosporobacter quercicolus]